MALRELNGIVVGTTAELTARNDSSPLYDVLLIDLTTGAVKVAPAAGDGYADIAALPAVGASAVYTAPDASKHRLKVANDGTVSSEVVT